MQGGAEDRSDFRQRLSTDDTMSEDLHATADVLSTSSSSQQRVRDWVDMTEDNLTSSGVFEADDVTLSQNSDDEVDKTEYSHDPVIGDQSVLSPETWDRFQTVPHEEHDGQEGFTTFMRGVKVVWSLFLLLAVLGAGVCNKLSLLTLSSGLLKGDKKGGSSNPRATMLVVALCFPYLCQLLTYSVRSFFGSSHWPTLRMTLTVLFLELCHTGGVCLLLFSVLPRVDMLRGLVLMTLVYVTPALLYVITCLTGIMTSCRRRLGLACLALVAFLIQLGGVGVAMYQGFVYNTTEGDRLQQVLAAGRTGDLGVQRSAPHIMRSLSDLTADSVRLPLALILTSFGFWENYFHGDFRLCGRAASVARWKARLASVRHRLYVLVCLAKMALALGLVLLLVPGFSFSLTFPSDPPAASTSTLLLPFTPAANVTEGLQLPATRSGAQQHLETYGPLYLMLTSAALCSYLSGLACKLCLQVVGFALPLSLVTPCAALVLMVECQYQVLTLRSSRYAWVCPDVITDVTSWTSYHVFMLAAAWLSQILLTWHVWKPNPERMEKIEKLFVTPMRCAILTDQTLLAKRKIHYKKVYLEAPELGDLEGSLDSDDVTGKPQTAPLIYACATMWHETRDEMIQMMKSLFRMDIDRSARFIAQKYYNVKDPDYYDFEAHIFFDDALEMNPERMYVPNAFVTAFVDCLDEAISAVHERPTSLGDPVRTATPYGGRLTWVLPGGTPLVAHLKDKRKIRHKKRWSQVMYLYYLLGYKILASAAQRQPPVPEDLLETESGSGATSAKDETLADNTTRVRLTSSELRRRRAAAHFTRSVIFSDMPEMVQDQAENTYILALDGDVDFRPDAVRLLLDRMKKNKKVGAACGRIHPTGSGPIVWYQQFEYAVGHWLQKATEHVFGCVLCAPGCFSLFRGSALMDDNVTRTYATRSSKSKHYIQYDQGEDRWLSTLLLQQGYRIDYSAAADAFTHAPETFSEFFNQRRRWGPSTLANVLDLLGSWRLTVGLNDNLSTLYMAYQALLLVSSILGPATVLLLMAGSFTVVFKTTVVQSYALTLVLPLAYVLLCLYASPRVQIAVGAAVSALYALVMTIVLVGTVGTAVTGSITSPNVLFLFTVIVVFILASLVHPKEVYCILPGLLYLVMIPAGYLVLTIYFLANLHIVSWGTREVAKPSPGQDKQAGGTEREDEKGGLLAWLGVPTLLREAGRLLKRLHSIFSRGGPGKRGKLKQGDLTRTEQLLEELIATVRERGVRAPRDARGRCHHTHDDDDDDDVISGSEGGASTLRAVQGRGGKRHVSDDVVEASDHSASSSSSSRSWDSAEDSDKLPAAAPERNLTDGGGPNTRQPREDKPIPGTAEKEEEGVEDERNPSWLSSPACGTGPVAALRQREWGFWRQLIARYLQPLRDDPQHLRRVQDELRALRNHVVVAFLMISAIWIALTMQLEVLQSELQMFLYVHVPRLDRGPPLKFQPLGLVFMASFALILLTQFLGMGLHRWGTFLHTLAITNLRLGRAHGQQEKVRDAILHVIELQKLRNIELEPDDPDDTASGRSSSSDHRHGPASKGSDQANPAAAAGRGRRRASLLVDDAVSVASAMTARSARRRAADDYVRPLQHSHLVRPFTASRQPSTTRTGAAGRSPGYYPGQGGDRGRDRGPVGNFTLQRAFEKRFRHQAATAQRDTQGGRLTSAADVFRHGDVEAGLYGRRVALEEEREGW